MHKLYFPSCDVEGEIEPAIPYNHLGITGAVPNKCGNCPNLFEGGCTRNIKNIEKYLHLDYGKCTVNGPTDPVEFENEFVKSKVEIPRKCSTCSFLNLDYHKGFYCKQDEKKWGYYSRGLDWGSWTPNSVYLELALPKVTTKKMSKFVNKNDLVSFIKEYRLVNPELSMNEAKEDFKYLRRKIEES